MAHNQDVHQHSEPLVNDLQERERRMRQLANVFIEMFLSQLPVELPGQIDAREAA